MSIVNSNMACSIEEQRYCGKHWRRHQDDTFTPYMPKEVKEQAKDCGIPMRTKSRKGSRSHQKSTSVLCAQLRSCSRGGPCVADGSGYGGRYGRRTGRVSDYSDYAKWRSVNSKYSDAKFKRDHATWGVGDAWKEHAPTEYIRARIQQGYDPHVFKGEEYGPLMTGYNIRAGGDPVQGVSTFGTPSASWGNYGTEQSTRDLYNKMLTNRGLHTAADRSAWPALPGGAAYAGAYGAVPVGGI